MINNKTLEVGALGVVLQGTTVYSAPWVFTSAKGYTSIQIGSTAGSIAVTQQCSMDGVNYYDPVDVNGYALGAIVTGMTVGTKFITYDPVPAPYIRFKVVEGNVAGTVVLITVTSLE